MLHVLYVHVGIHTHLLRRAFHISMFAYMILRVGSWVPARVMSEGVSMSLHIASVHARE
jgi:hypothetical protein